MGDQDEKLSNRDLEHPGHTDEGGEGGEEGEEGGNRPTGGDKAAHAGAVGQHPDSMRERGTVDPDKPDPSGGPPG